MKAEEMALFQHLLCKFEALNSDPPDPCKKLSTVTHTRDPGDGKAGCRACHVVKSQASTDSVSSQCGCLTTCTGGCPVTDFHTHTWAPMHIPSYERIDTPYTRKFIVRIIFRKSIAFQMFL